MKNVKLGLGGVIEWLKTAPKYRCFKVNGRDAFNLPRRYEPLNNCFSIAEPWVAKAGYNGEYTHFDGNDYHKGIFADPTDGNAIVEKMVEWGFFAGYDNPGERLRTEIAIQLLELSDKMDSNLEEIKPDLVNWLQDYILVEMIIPEGALVWSDDHTGVDTYRRYLAKKYCVFITERMYDSALMYEHRVRHVSKEWIQSADENTIIGELKDWGYEKITKIVFCSDGQIREK